MAPRALRSNRRVNNRGTQTPFGYIEAYTIREKLPQIIFCFSAKSRMLGHFCSDHLVELKDTSFPADFPGRTLVNFDFVADLLISVFGDEKVGSSVLVSRFNAAGEVHSVANNGSPLVFSPADGANDNCAVMQANSDVETSSVNRFKVWLHGFDGIQHLKTGLKGARHHVLRSLDSEYRENSVAHVIIDHA